MAKRKKRKRRKAKLVVAVIVVAAAGYGFWQFWLARGKDNDPTIPISIKKGAIVDRLTETGTVEYARVVEVKSAISGRVVTLAVDDGHSVKQGDVMAVIEPDPDQALRLSQKAVSVRRSRIIWKQTEKEYQRLSELRKKQLISEEQLENADDARNLARHNYDLAKMELKILQEDVKSVGSEPLEGNPNEGDEANPDGEDDDDSEIILQDFRVQAPLAGIVIERRIEEGDMVIRGTSSFTQGTTLFRIGDPRKIIVASGINEIDEAKLSVGMPVKIVPNADEQKTYRGKIEKIAPLGINVNNLGIVYFRVEILFLEPDSFLKQGMSCDVDIVLDEREDSYYLPVEAILKIYKKDKEGKETKQIDKYTVFKKIGNKYEDAEVTVGLKSETRMEILSGLKPEDKIYPDAEKISKKQKQEKEKGKASPNKGRRGPFHRKG
ncbi:efflux RND transporter periplasmic adaptor subunit [bacterium]|nr:efflux RND transporter periplasmic adaptor subunit [bacterium]